MHTCGGRISGQALTPPIVPIFDKHIVPCVNYLEVSLADVAKVLNFYNYYCILTKLQSCTFFMLGTTRPLGESIAILML